MSSGHMVGIIGLGRMGLPLCENLRDKGYYVVGYDLSEEHRNRIATLNMTSTVSIEEFCERLSTPRQIILLVPSGGPVDSVLLDLLQHLLPGDIVIDAGNSHYLDSVRRRALLANHEVGYLDVGISGGLKGARYGACLTIGGDRNLYDKTESLFCDIAKTNGYMYVGPSGWGHLVKTIHNGIEYGFLQAIGEGLNLIRVIAEKECVPVDISQLCTVWNNGSIIESRLMGDAADAVRLLEGHPEIAGAVGGGETGGWAQTIAIQAGESMPALDAALEYRKKTCNTNDFTGKVIAAIRHLFGGHGFTRC
jgi:6-phosphogluconate dehydrogenase